MAQMHKMGVPQGYHSLTPYITVKDVAQSIDFYRRALGAEERMRLATPDGKKVMHGEVAIGDSVVMLGEENGERGCVAPSGLKGHSAGLYFYVPDVDAAFTQAKGAGAKVTMPVSDMFWGDRVAEFDEGDPRMNCQLCKYRTRITGYEDAVGAPQQGHHHHVRCAGVDHHHHGDGHSHEHD